MENLLEFGRNNDDILCKIRYDKTNQIENKKRQCNLKEFWEQHGTDRLSCMTFFKNLSLMLINHHDQQLDNLFNKEQHEQRTDVIRKLRTLWINFLMQKI